MALGVGLRTLGKSYEPFGGNITGTVGVTLIPTNKERETVVMTGDTGSVLPTALVITKKNDCIYVLVNKQNFEERLNLSKHSLIACFILSKRNSPWKLDQLKQKLGSIWKLPS